MSEWYEPLLDRGYIPIPILRLGIKRQLHERLQQITSQDASTALQHKLSYVNSLKKKPIAIHTSKANEQHYEVSTEFLQLCLGPRMKYSSCLFEDGVSTLSDAEDAMLASYVKKAQISDGMRILDLGCGWGSLCLYLAERFPSCTVSALSNSSTQKLYIDSVAKSKSLTNLTVFTGDATEFEFDPNSFDRVLTIEMFEHMKNYKVLLQKCARWLCSQGRLFIHLFCHKAQPYDFAEGDGWMTTHFFTGGTMPSADLLLYFQEDLNIENHWLLSGKNYAQTCEDWLKLLLKNRKAAYPHLEKTYGHSEASRWFNRWLVFYLACAELFAYNGGEEWMVAHYLFRKP